MGVVNKTVGRVLRKAARMIDPPQTINLLKEEYITWRCYPDPGMLVSRDDLPFTFEKTADEFFDAWKDQETCADVLGRSCTLGGTLSFCYIDGNHTYEYAKRDFLNCDAYLENGGFILFDDSTLTEFTLHKLMPEVMAMDRYRLVAANPYHLFQKIKAGPQASRK
jgi:hypothetical protein